MNGYVYAVVTAYGLPPMMVVLGVLLKIEVSLMAVLGLSTALSGLADFLIVGGVILGVIEIFLKYA